MTAALLAITVLSPSPLDTPITFHGPTANLAAVMSDVAAQANVEITVQGAPERDYIYLQVKERPLRKVLDLVAQTTQSKWTETAPGRYKIHAPWDASAPDPTDIEAVQRWLAANPVPAPLNRQQAEEWVASGVEAFALPQGQARTLRMSELSDRTPPARVLIAFLHALGPEKIASVPSGEWQTYLQHPIGSALPHPPAVRVALDRLPSDLLFLRDAMDRRGVEAEKPLRRVTNLWSDADLGSQPAHDWRLSLYRSGFFVVATLHRVDKDGSYAFPSKTLPLALHNPEPSRNPFPEPDAPFAWPPEISSMLRPAREVLRSTRPLPEGVINRYAQCGQEETLTGGFESPLAAYAAARKSDLIAVIPDTAIDALAACPSETDRAREALARLFPLPVIEEAKGVISIRPLRLHQSRLDRLPRKEAAIMFGSAARAGSPTLDSLADVCFKTDSREAFRRAEQTTRSFTSFPRYDSVDPFALDLYAWLSPPLRETVQRGEVIIPVRNLPAGARKRLSAFVCGVFSEITNDPDRMSLMSTGLHGLSADPTAMIDDRVLLNSKLSFGVDKRWLIATVNPDAPHEHPPTAAPEAFAKVSAERLALPIYHAFTEATLRVQLQLPDRCYLTGRFRLYDFPRAFRGAPFKDLPPEVQRLAAEASDHEQPADKPSKTATRPASTHYNNK